MDDDRLVHETLRSAVAMGARVANRLKAIDVRLKEGKIEALTVRDARSGREFEIQGKHFVSTVGPWTDRVATDLLKDWKKILRPSKGVHLTFNRSRFDVQDAIVMAADNDKRIVFGIPRHEMYIIGTTDTDFTGDPKDVSVTAEDVRYLLSVAGHYFPGAKLTKDDIVSCYAGVRPLVDDGAATESKTSREHVIINDPRNITFVAGGKYTTYRRMALDTVESTLDFFDLEDRVRFGRSQTEVPLNPRATVEALSRARNMIDRLTSQTGLDRRHVELLVERHAMEHESVLKYDPGQALSSSERMWVMEAKHAIRETMCDSLVDFYTRRVPLFLAESDHGLRFLMRISRAFQEELSWSDAERAAQCSALQRFCEKELSWRGLV
jgi:glycerol-3-phosphate dehydrogenase